MASLDSTPGCDALSPTVLLIIPTGWWVVLSHRAVVVRSLLLAVGVADGRTASLPMLGVGKGCVGASGVCAVHFYSCDSWCVATIAWEVGGVVYDLCPGYNHLPGGVGWRGVVLV